ncbi:MAG: hypothetical protein GY830_09695 [Bacteroidetes bacterium]|nr:hypothetical protein [Bacteroidota bacterium]
MQKNIYKFLLVLSIFITCDNPETGNNNQNSTRRDPNRITQEDDSTIINDQNDSPNTQENSTTQTQKSNQKTNDDQKNGSSISTQTQNVTNPQISNDNDQNDTTDQKETDLENTKNISEKMINSISKEFKLDKDYVNANLGLTFGGAIGDSIGSYLEFFKGKIKQTDIDRAMVMPGGGCWNVSSGQITDDTELAISCAKGLVDFIDSKEKIFDINYIAKRYNEWYKSGPFDIGGTTSQTLGSDQEPGNNFAFSMKKNAKEENLRQQKHHKSAGAVANGTLMRCMPLVAYGSKLSDDDLFELIKQDASMSHANYYIYYMETCYAIACKYLINSFNKIKTASFGGIQKIPRNQIAFMKAEKWIQSMLSKEKILIKQQILKEIQTWLANCKTSNNSKFYPATTHMGYARIAFERAFYHLWKGSSFYDAIKDTISEEGDTDTNACIVGGLLGAFHGSSGISDKFLKKILDCKPNKNRKDFQAKYYFNGKLLGKILQNAPSKFEFKNYKIIDEIKKDEIKLN